MRVCLAICLPLCFALSSASNAQTATGGPTDAKAQKSYAEGQELLKQRKTVWALDAFKKAAKQDGRCIACYQKVVELAAALGDDKAAIAAG